MMSDTHFPTWSARGQFTALTLLTLAPFILGAGADNDAAKQELAGAAAVVSNSTDEPSITPAHLIPVPLPISGTVDTQIKRKIDRVLSESAGGGARPTLILEFRGSDESRGEGSEFERSLSLARFLASDRLRSVRTVAYLPSGVKGHAVLPVLACEEFIIHPDAEFGQAGIAEPYIDSTVRSGYGETARRRRTVPVAVALGMLDKELSVLRVETVDGLRYVTGDELAGLRRETTVDDIQTLIPAGDMGRFTGTELRLEHGFASHLARDRKELAAALNISADLIEQDPSLGGAWRPLRIDIRGPINAKAVNWTLRSLKQSQQEHQANFFCIWIDSAGGSAEDSLRLAGFLASLDPAEIRTVAFVPTLARGDAALIAWSCDELVLGPEAVLGGPGEAQVSDRDAPELRHAIKSLAEDKGRDWSLPVALVDPDLPVHRYSHEASGVSRIFCEEELADQEDAAEWKQVAAVPTEDGLSGREAEELKLARHLADSLAEFRQLYHLDQDFEFLRPNWAHLLIERLASPRLAGILLFVAWFTLLIEFAQPGVGVAGFVSALCFVLFFWSQMLHGTAGWLEVLLFGTGVVAVVLEIFVIPGFGIFGIGGAVLIVGSIVLASQTFFIPQNSYQFQQLPNSLMMVAAAGAGAFASVAVIHRYLPDAPFLSRLMLPQPDVELRDEIQRRESIADFGYLQGKRGRTTTQLTPSGKARIGDDVVNVISDGELIASGTDVLVAEVRGNRVLVKMIDS